MVVKFEWLLDFCRFYQGEDSTYEQEEYKIFYCCPIKIYLRHKNKADFICEVSLFLLDFCRQTKLIQLWAKVYILADSRSIVRS